MVADKRIRISVVYSPGPRQVREVKLLLEPSCTVLMALQASGLLQLFPALDPQTLVPGVWGRKTSLSQTLRDMDRVEIYRALRVDPKVARRERFVRQGARTTGLFERKRQGAKAGY